MIDQANNITPAHLWIGSHDELVIETHRWLQAFLNTCNGCHVCALCRAITQQQHHAVTWLSTQSGYVLDDLDPLLHTISFALEKDQHHVFVIEHADRLTAACSNRLLKTIEEPPVGYHFIFLSERLDDILPTLRSRCIIKRWQQSGLAEQQDMLTAFFMTTEFQSPQAFFQELEKRKPSEQTTLALLDSLLIHWLGQLRQAYLDGDAKRKKNALRIVTLLRLCFTRPLMPGSSKFIWRDLFLQMHCG